MIREYLKRIAFGTSLLIIAPAAFMAWVEKKADLGDKIFLAWSQLLALLPGIFGTYLRSAYYYTSLLECSWEIHIGFGTHFSSRNAILGRHVSMGSYCVIGDVILGKNVLIASRVSIPSGKHQHLVRTLPKFDTLYIGDNSWIGEGAIILADVGRDCVIAAGTVVTKAVNDSQTVGGNPGKLLKKPTETLQDNL